MFPVLNILTIFKLINHLSWAGKRPALGKVPRCFRFFLGKFGGNISALRVANGNFAIPDPSQNFPEKNDVVGTFQMLRRVRHQLR